MNQIKFRIYSTSTKRWYFSDDPESTMTVKDLQEGNSGTWKVMQFTGLKDKNGKEIYNGDIFSVQNWGTNFEIVWETDAGAWRLRSLDENKGMMGLGCLSELIEIIGNIYDNPELLK